MDEFKGGTKAGYALLDTQEGCPAVKQVPIGQGMTHGTLLLSAAPRLPPSLMMELSLLSVDAVPELFESPSSGRLVAIAALVVPLMPPPLLLLPSQVPCS